MPSHYDKIYQDALDSNPYVKRAGIARDLLAKADMGAYMREITLAASAHAGGDHAEYLRFVQQQIAERQVAQPQNTLDSYKHMGANE